jgi:hypothetical protein
MIHKKYINKKYIIYFCILVFIIYNIIYYWNFKEGLKLKKIGKSISKGVSDTVNQSVTEVQKTAENVSKETQQIAENASKEAQQIAENAAKEAQKIADDLNIANELKKMIEPISKLTKSVLNTLKFLKQF